MSQMQRIMSFFSWSERHLHQSSSRRCISSAPSSQANRKPTTMAQPQSRTTGGAGVTGSYGLMPGAAGGDGSHSHISRTTGGAGVTGSYGPNDTSSSKSEQQPAPVTTTNESSQGGSSSPAPAADDNMRVPGDPRAAIALTEPLHHSKL